MSVSVATVKHGGSVLFTVPGAFPFASAVCGRISAAFPRPAVRGCAFFVPASAPHAAAVRPAAPLSPRRGRQKPFGSAAACASDWPRPAIMKR